MTLHPFLHPLVCIHSFVHSFQPLLDTCQALFSVLCCTFVVCCVLSVLCPLLCAVLCRVLLCSCSSCPSSCRRKTRPTRARLLASPPGQETTRSSTVRLLCAHPSSLPVHGRRFGALHSFSSPPPPPTPPRCRRLFFFYLLLVFLFLILRLLELMLGQQGSF